MDLSGGFLGKRKMREYEETFYILLCELKFYEPITDLLVTTDLIAVPTSGTAEKAITVNSIYYRPSD